MDDLNAKINELLSDPNSLEQLKGLGEMLGINTSTDMVHSKKKQNQSNDISSMLSPDMMGAVTKLMPMLTSLNKEDDTTRLLNALRPFLSDERKQKLDTASKLIKMMKLLPMIKDTKILDSLF